MFCYPCREAAKNEGCAVKRGLRQNRGNIQSAGSLDLSSDLAQNFNIRPIADFKTDVGAMLEGR